MLCIIALIASTFSTLSRVQNFILTLHSLAEKVELFFLAHLFCFLWVDWNSGFEKTSLWKKGWLQKVWQKKTTKGWLCESRQKDHASHEVRMVGIFGGWGYIPVELPVIYFQVKPDLWFDKLYWHTLQKVHQYVSFWVFDLILNKNQLICIFINTTWLRWATMPVLKGIETILYRN